MDKATVISELQKVAKSLDAKFLSRSMFQQHGAISSGVVEKTFGSWNEAILAADLEPLPQGGVPKDEYYRLERLVNPPTAGNLTSSYS